MRVVKKIYIDANPKHTADTKAKASQYFTILNRIEYVIDMGAKYSEEGFLFFFNNYFGGTKQRDIEGLENYQEVQITVTKK